MALITNIQGCEWHQREVVNQGLKPEYPRASTTDDVEYFFSMMRDSIGQDFNTKQVNFGIRKYMQNLQNAWTQICHFITILQVTYDFMKGLYLNLMKYQ